MTATVITDEPILPGKSMTIEELNAQQSSGEHFPPTDQRLSAALRKYWGFADFLPLQSEAVAADLEGRDSLVVLPTGGGKSLCYQLPAVVSPGWTLVISPLLSLMKDQVDRLRRLGISAAALNSATPGPSRSAALRDLRAGSLKLLYVAPERVVGELGRDFLRSNPPRSVIVDEAHCISAWGHDFRPEYRGLKQLRDAFPEAAWHAFTATATLDVRQDICQQLALRDPQLLVGSFFRPNLQYHVLPREGGWADLCRIIDRHRNSAGIIYAISRKKVEQLSNHLNGLGYRTLPYHAGMSDIDRAAAQEALLHDRIEALVATVAFGMGIDKPNVRYVIHAELPRSLENYQQESGRAGRDGLPAECWLLHSAQDAMVWRRILEQSASEVRAQAEQGLDRIQSYCSGMVCRHRQLVGHFGQGLPESVVANCGACDVCLGSMPMLDDALITAQKILSCVIRVGERFGAEHVAKVLKGSSETRLAELGHDRLSTYGLLKEFSRTQIRDWIEQLVSQRLLERIGEYSVLQVTPLGRAILKGQGTVQLGVRRSRSVSEGEESRAKIVPKELLQGVDLELFQLLSDWRRKTADAAAAPAFVIFGDRTLIDLAQRRPADETNLRLAYGVGAQKVADYGAAVLELVDNFCRERQLERNCQPAVMPSPANPRPPIADSSRAAWPYFEQGKSCAEVAQLMGRAVSTVEGYLTSYLTENRVTDPSPWVGAEDAAVIEQAIEQVGDERLKPIFEHLAGQQTYPAIRVVVSCRRNRAAKGDGGHFQ
jgi:ATP-dependent DNA helicase RecQ